MKDKKQLDIEILHAKTEGIIIFFCSVKNCVARRENYFKKDRDRLINHTKDHDYQDV